MFFEASCANEFYIARRLIWWSLEVTAAKMAIIAVHHTTHIESVPRGFPSGIETQLPYPNGIWNLDGFSLYREILEIPCLVLSQKMVLSVSFDKLLVELAQAAGPSLAALAWSCSFRGHILYLCFAAFRIQQSKVFFQGRSDTFFQKKVTANTLCRQVYVCS